MPHYGLITEQSRKAKAARSVYDYLRQKVKAVEWIPEIVVDDIRGIEGIQVPEADKYRVFNMRIHEEYLSPYFRTDMNLFHLLMMDENVGITIYRAERGWLFILTGIPAGPKPFGQNGYDMR